MKQIALVTALCTVFIVSCEPTSYPLYPEQFKKVEALCKDYDGVKIISRGLDGSIFVVCRKKGILLEVPKNIRDMRE